jgi:hypothetical protein
MSLFEGALELADAVIDGGNARTEAGAYHAERLPFPNKTALHPALHVGTCQPLATELGRRCPHIGLGWGDRQIVPTSLVIKERGLNNLNFWSGGVVPLW